MTYYRCDKRVINTYRETLERHCLAGDRRHKSLSLLLCVVLILTVTFSDCWAADCSINEVFNHLEIVLNEHELQLLKGENAISYQEKELLEVLPKKGNMSIGALMTVDQAEKYGRLQGEFIALTTDHLIESGLERDLIAVREMWEGAEAERQGVAPPKMTNVAPLGLLHDLRAPLTPRPVVQSPVGNQPKISCSIDDALAAQIYDADTRVKSFPTRILQADHSIVKVLEAKHRSLDLTKMDAEDRKALAVADSSVAPILRELTFESDVQNARDFWIIAQEVHDDRVADMRETGFDLQAVGKTEQATYLAKTPRQQMLFRAWDALNEEMPSTWYQLMQRMATASQQVNQTHAGAK